MNKKVTTVLSYATLPGIVPWLKGLGLNFGYLAYLMALIFRSVRLLPVHHPYLMIQNMGRFSIRQVLAAGAQNLHGGTRNIDQYIIFIGFLTGIVLLVGQFVLLFAAIAIHSAEASGLTQACAHTSGFCFSMFNTTNPGTDVAFVLLDYVFQIPGMFNSIVMFDTATGLPLAYNDISQAAKGMHMLFAFYSRGMLLIAVLIVCYYAFVVVVETAQTGVPFGARFANVYVPIRLIIALTLLVPTYYGLNSGQWLTLKIAKMGSSLATNAWLVHNNVAGDNPLGLTMREMVVSPHIEDIGSVVTFFELTRVCEFAYKLQYNKDIKAYIVRPAAYNAVMDSQELTAASDFTNTLTFTGNGAIRIVNGEKDTAKYGKYLGFVKPYCGAITLEVDSINVPGIRTVYETYFNMMKQMWVAPDFIVYGLKTALIQYSPKGQKGDACGPVTTTPWGAICTGTAPTCECKDAGYSFHIDQKQLFQVNFDTQMTAAISTLRGTTNDYMKMTPSMKDLGWGGAGVWFSRLGDYNGALVTAAIKIPTPTSMPAVMEFTRKIKSKVDKNGKPTDKFDPILPTGKTVDNYWQEADLDDPSLDMKMATFLNKVYSDLNGADMSADLETKKNSSPVIDTINQIFGISGLYELRKNSDVIPLSRLAALGRGIIERSITFLGGSLIMSGLGGIMGAMDTPGASGMAKGLSAVSSMISSLGLVGLSIGVTLYYIIPMMPFLYFFFAVGRWVKSIFEAMVGIPLWALAHIKIDGEGIPAQAAANGYYLLLEIMIRPILTVFGLLAAMTIFNASVVMLDSIFNVVVRNVGGYDPYPAGSSGAFSAAPKTFEQSEVAREAIDEFMYTLIYAFILYIIGTSAFKLIDLIPNGVLRFIGSGVSSFNEKAADPLASMTRYTSAAPEFTQQLRAGISNLGEKSGDAVAGIMGAGGSGRAGSFAQGKMGVSQSLGERMKR